MSKIGKLPIEIKEGTNVSIENGIVNISGPKGSFTHTLLPGIKVEKNENKLVVSLKEEELKKTRKKNIQELKALFGLTRATLANMATGVTDGFEKKLELAGVGYRAQVSGSDLTLSLGFSHPVKVAAPAGITFKVAENTIIVSGINKELVGDTASKIRAIRPPEPYKGKGISYKGEKIRRKAGKAAKAVGSK